MKKPRRKHRSKRWRWRIEWLVQAGLGAAVSRLPAAMVFRLGEGLGALAWPFMGGRRHAILRNLRIAFGHEHDLPTLRRMARETFLRTAANLLSVGHTARRARSELVGQITIEKCPLIDEALAAGRGLVMLPSHMGNWEVLSRVSHLYAASVKAGAFYRPLNNPLVNARIVAQREADGTRMFSKRDTFHQASGFLRDGGFLGILADQRVGRQGDLTPFFGRLTRASPLPSLLARRSKSEVLAMSMTTIGPAKWHVRFHPVAAPFATADCMRAIEQAMRASPCDVFWLQERWKVFIGPNFTIRDWLGGTESCGGENPHRALLWLAEAPDEWQLPDAWRHPDVVYEAVLAAGQSPPAWLPENTRIHRVSVHAGLRALRNQLVAIDATTILPVDYILAATASRTLAKASRREAIPLVSLTPPP